MHSCPLLQLIPGVRVESYVVDEMHGLHLGDVLHVVAFVIWFVPRLGVFKPDSVHIDTEDCYRLGLLKLKGLPSPHIN